MNELIILANSINLLKEIEKGKLNLIGACKQLKKYNYFTIKEARQYLQMVSMQYFNKPLKDLCKESKEKWFMKM